MARFTLITAVVLLCAPCVFGVVFINEVFINPPGSGNDDTREYIELLGTPGMKLDGYAVAILNGIEQKLYPLGSIPPLPNPLPEIDEFFSLDRLELGPNGMLVIGIGAQYRYGQLLTDTNFQRWDTIWNGGLDDPGKLSNDGSNTVVLIRNRPGRTEADPTNPDGLRWGKDIAHDYELITPVLADVCTNGTNNGTPCKDDGDCSGGGVCVPGYADQFGDGNPDKGQPNGLGGNTLDLKGASTPGASSPEIDDDLEIVDEISYEHGRGLEYDLDDRTVDIDSTNGFLPERNVHALDDPEDFNPDVLTRVDYRTKGDGWEPIGGATGQLPNGNNWQDTATEQWIRGESVDRPSGAGSAPYFFYSIAAAASLQPYVTNVPLWLDDSTPPDFDFTTADTYQIMAGRLNPLAVAFIPGDTDRDGDCDTDDIDKLAAVFGDEDWIFSNSYEEAPEGDEGDPATQTRPWDVDGTGANGIEASDLQWVLNFQANTNGRIVGVQYDDTAPAASGVVLNPNAGTACTVTGSTSVASGRSLSDLRWGDRLALTVSGQVTAGANATAGQENGIMQFVHDVVCSTGGVVEVTSVEKLGSYVTTRDTLESPAGTNGDLGIDLVNGYTTSFTEGLTGPAALYRVNLRVVGAGAAALTVQAADAPRFAASTPEGLKLGHTDNQGNPSGSAYPAAINLTAFGGPGDHDGNGTVDLDDYVQFGACLVGPGGGILSGCEVFDFDVDDDVDVTDFADFQSTFGM